MLKFTKLELLERITESLERMDHCRRVYGTNKNQEMVIAIYETAKLAIEAEGGEEAIKAVADLFRIGHPDCPDAYAFTEKAETAQHAHSNGYDIQQYVKLEKYQRAILA